MSRANTAMLEDQLQAAVIELCKLRGVLVHHCRPAQLRSGRWGAPIQGDAGFVDLVLAGRERVLFRELKSDFGRLAPAQSVWSARLQQAGADWALWTPRDLHSGRIAAEIEAIR